MALQFVEIPLFSDFYYSYDVNLEQENITLTFRYNERSLAWCVDIQDQEGNYLIAGVKLVPDYPLTHNHSINGLTGYFSLESKLPEHTEKIRTEPENIAEHFVMFYQYETEE